MLRSLYLTVLVTATLTVLVLSVLALVGVPIIDLPPARALYPTAVGGHLIPINKLAIIAIYIALVGLITAVTVVSLITARGKKREN